MKDPDTSLKTLRELASRILGQEAEGEEIPAAYAAALAVRFEDLDRHLTAAGELPAEWCADGDRS